MSSGARHLALTCSRTSRRQAPKAINAITAIDQATFNDAKFVGEDHTHPRGGGAAGTGGLTTYATAVKRLSKTDVNHDRHGPSLNRSKVGNICQAIDMQIVSATLHKRFNLAFNARLQCIASPRRDETRRDEPRQYICQCDGATSWGDHWEREGRRQLYPLELSNNQSDGQVVCRMRTNANVKPTDKLSLSLSLQSQCDLDWDRSMQKCSAHLIDD